MNSKCQRKTPMFIKIVLENTIKERILEIPSEFVREFGNSLKNPIILEVPNGTKWQLKMSKIGEEFWLVKGWVEFLEHHSLQKGHLLVFKYEGNSKFNVLIFDMSAMEIDYPGCSRDAINKEFTALISDQQQHIQGFGGNVASSSRVETSGNFTSRNPWFNIHLQSVNMQNKFLVVPFSFIKKYMKCESKTTMLKVEDKSWAVKLNVYSNKSMSIMNGGVTSFLKDNSLKEGDVCVFELTDNNVFSVSIFKI